MLGMKVTVMSKDGKRPVFVGTVIRVRAMEVQVFAQGRACWYPTQRIRLWK